MVAVWAPRAQKVELMVGDQVFALESACHGWWRTSRELAPNDDYLFRVNGETSPDPRSPWQPEGIELLHKQRSRGRSKWPSLKPAYTTWEN
jgi:maltooligosyltrehalose trehalohydrolase